MRRVFALALIGLCSSAFAQEINPGWWLFKWTYTPVSVGTATVSEELVCIEGTTAEGIRKRFEGAINAACKITPSDRSGNTATFEITCPAPYGDKGKGVLRWGGDTFAWELHLVDRFSKTYVGRRVGRVRIN
jgi:hypothetical protein